MAIGENSPLDFLADAPLDVRPRLRVPDEPWYYGWLDGAARLMIGACLALAALALLGGVAGALWAIGNSPDPRSAILLSVMTAPGPPCSPSSG